jgi:hypothetical protein
MVGKIYFLYIIRLSEFFPLPDAGLGRATLQPLRVTANGTSCFKTCYAICCNMCCAVAKTKEMRKRAKLRSLEIMLGCGYAGTNM